MDTLMACCVWWLFKQDINQRWKEQCTEWKRIWSVKPPQKQDEAQALQEKTDYDKPDNIGIINKSDSLQMECVYSLI